MGGIHDSNEMTADVIAAAATACPGAKEGRRVMAASGEQLSDIAANNFRLEGQASNWRKGIFLSPESGVMY